MSQIQHNLALCLETARPDEITDAAIAILQQRLQYGESLSSPDDVWQFASLKLCLHDREVFACLFLDNRHHLIAYEELFYGTLNQATVYPRIVVQRTLQLNAAAIIIAHNHTSSGEPEPSLQDKDLTKRIQEVLSLIDVQVLDHVIVAHEGYMSFSRRGLL